MSQAYHEALSRLELLKAKLKEQTQPKFSVESFCFPEQVAFIRDPARFKTAVASRRGGKTTSCAAHLLDAALANPKRVCFYITLTRSNAKRLVWREILDINREFNLNGKANESELSIIFPNGSIIYFSGANDRASIEKFRGFAITLCYLDECQSFPAYIEELIEEVISKALFDYNGTLCLIGTPGKVPVGYFYEMSHNLEWSHHHWTMFQNPWLEIKSGKKPQEILEEELLRKGVTIDDPTIQRECFGQWVTDSSNLVFRYNVDLNDFGALPSIKGEWTHILGVDIGFSDSDAISVLAFSDQVDGTYLVEEIITPKQGITELADQIDHLILKYNPMKIVMDTGGLGKKIAEEITKRRRIPVSAAEKTRKMEYIELLNDAMRTRKFFAKKKSRFAIESGLIEIDKDKTTSDRTVISDRFHSDICDAVLYAFRESLNWNYKEPEVKAKPNTPEWYLEETKRMEDELLELMEQDKFNNNVWGDS